MRRGWPRARGQNACERSAWDRPRGMGTTFFHVNSTRMGGGTFLGIYTASTGISLCDYHDYDPGRAYPRDLKFSFFIFTVSTLSYFRDCLYIFSFIP